MLRREAVGCVCRVGWPRNLELARDCFGIPRATHPRELPALSGNDFEWKLLGANLATEEEIFETASQKDKPESQLTTESRFSRGLSGEPTSPSLVPTPRHSRKMMRDGLVYDFIWL